MKWKFLWGGNFFQVVAQKIPTWSAGQWFVRRTNNLATSYQYISPIASSQPWAYSIADRTLTHRCSLWFLLLFLGHNSGEFRPARGPGGSGGLWDLSPPDRPDRQVNINLVNGSQISGGHFDVLLSPVWFLVNYTKKSVDYPYSSYAVQIQIQIFFFTCIAGKAFSLWTSPFRSLI